MANLLSVERVYGDGLHNAFTDLLHWKGHYYLTFRSAEQHGIEPPGVITIMRSEDLEVWSMCGRISTGGDDRDPKLIDAGDRLAVVFGTWKPRWNDHSIGNEVHDLISHIASSHDGIAWSYPRQVYAPNYWLWRVFSAEENYLSAAYHFPLRGDRENRLVTLIESDDLLDWRHVAVMREGYGSGEAVLYQPEPGRMNCIVRAIRPDNHSWIGHSEAPYHDWEWADLGVMIHAPVVLEVGGTWICAGRSQVPDLPEGTVEEDSGAHTSVWKIEGDSAEHLLTVPSGGDCSYAGLAFGPEGEVAMSYYSQHERMPLPEGQPTPADIFLARFEV